MKRHVLQNTGLRTQKFVSCITGQFGVLGSHPFLDALASLAFKLSVSETVLSDRDVRASTKRLKKL